MRERAALQKEAEDNRLHEACLAHGHNAIPGAHVLPALHGLSENARYGVFPYTSSLTRN
jgi:hypothetical protein